jgi:hypothetical protein
MAYTLGTVILLALIYLVIIVKKYSAVADVSQPQIKHLKQQIKKLVDGLEAETKLARSARLRVEDAKVGVSDIKMDISTTQKEMSEEKQREGQLEMGRYKKEFKRKS